jgi:protein ImuA
MNIIAPDSRLWASAAQLVTAAGAARKRGPPLGVEALARALPDGLAIDALHEAFASEDDAASGAAFAVLLAVHALGEGDAPILWVRETRAIRALGRLHAPGLAELGIAPDRLIQIEADDATATLRAAADAARCAGLGAVLIEPWGNPPVLDLTATRRLMLAAQHSGVMALLLRIGGRQTPSAAVTRWQVSAAPSVALEADAPGLPVFDVCLLRQRGGISGIEARLEWDRDACAFRDPALSGAVLSLAADRAAPPPPAA